MKHLIPLLPGHPLSVADPTDPAASAVRGSAVRCARLLALVTARLASSADAEDLVLTPLIAAWQAGLSNDTTDALDQLLPEQCWCWQTRERAVRAILGRLIAAGELLPPWLAGPAPLAINGAAGLDVALLRLIIGEWAQGAGGAALDASASPSGTVDRRAWSAARLPRVPAALAQTRPVAAALVRAGAPIEPARVTPARPRQHRPAPAPDAAARSVDRSARLQRLQGQLRERERARERAARHLDEMRRRYDRADTPEKRAAADVALAAAAVRHERMQAVCRRLARQVADLLATSGTARTPAQHRRRR